MKATFKPGMKSRIHRHSGLEAWYTISGETCLETPEGSMATDWKPKGLCTKQ